MDLRTERVSETVTRYLVHANVGPDSRVLLVRPDDGAIITGWRPGPDSTTVEGQWVSPFGDLAAVVVGVDLDLELDVDPHVLSLARPRVA
ncbi:MAG: hypothetical protein JWM12_87 [Ilumatobacteraceae bacterium]|jgi:hypothetical protein|nr:hypothetical protein [Ilumatobacteraceae bacterium]